MNEKNKETKEELQERAIEEQSEALTSEIFNTQEIEIEEVAIDGICGVY